MLRHRIQYTRTGATRKGSSFAGERALPIVSGRDYSKELRSKAHRLLCISLLIVLIAPAAYAGGGAAPAAKPAFTGREIDIQISHRTIGSSDAEAFIHDRSVYLNPLELFRFIHVHAVEAEDESVITGFYIDEARTFVIDNRARTIVYCGKSVCFAEDEMVVGGESRYIRSDLFERIFGLHCQFDFNRLRMEVSSDEKLPAEREKEDEQRRKEMAADRPRGASLDRAFSLSRSWLSAGALDWSLSGQHTATGNTGNYRLLFGGQLFGGDLDAELSGQSGQRLDWASTPWRWRLPIQNTSLLRTILVGRRAEFSNMMLADSMVGIQLSNAYAAGFRNSYTNYTISDRTEPDWLVELYVNEILAAYVKADQTGYYQFTIPLPYGSTDVRLRFIGPNGEIRTRDLAFRIPYTFLPPGEIEYQLTAGTSALHPDPRNAVAKTDVKIGVSTAMTLGGGLRYSTATDRRSLYRPFASGSLRLSRDLLGSAEYYHTSGIRSSLSYSSPEGFSIGAEYDATFAGHEIQLDESAIKDERELKISTKLPWNIGSFRFSADDFPHSASLAETQLSGTLVFGFLRSILSLTANSSYARDRFALTPASDVTGDVTLSLPNVWGVQFRPSVSLDYTVWKPRNFGLGASTFLSNSLSFNVAALYDLSARSTSLTLSTGLALPFAQLGFMGGTSASNTPSGPQIDAPQLTTSVQGAVMLDPSRAKLLADNRPEVRFGGIRIEPFLDRNDNGVRDPGEPLVPRVKLEQAPGKLVTDADGSLTLIGLEPYIPYSLRISMRDVENSSLMPRYQTFSIIPPANGIATITLPLVSVGQIEGFVYNTTVNGERPIGGIRIRMQHRAADDTSYVAPKEDLLSFSNGEFFYAGLAPGTYRIAPDSQQLELMHKTCEPPYRDVTIENKDDGDLIEQLNFTLLNASASSQAH